MSRLKGAYVLSPSALEEIYGPEERARIERCVETVVPPQTAESVSAKPEILEYAEVIMSGWGAPRFDGRLLAGARRLRAVFYGAGSVRGVVTPEFWDRGIIICSAWAANAIPVAEYAVSQIIFCLKKGWTHARETRQARRFVRLRVPGAYGSTVGIISLGMIGRRVCEWLRRMDVSVIACDPFVSPEEARNLGVEIAALDDVFRRSDVVSLHTPLLPETEGMIRGRHFEMMKQDASFINTARGAVVNETEMIEVLARRPDLTAVLDVTFPEPPAPESPLYTLPNVILTPHIAGSMGNECRRMGRWMAEEVERFAEGRPLKWRISREMAQRMA